MRCLGIHSIEDQGHRGSGQVQGRAKHNRFMQRRLRDRWARSSIAAFSLGALERMVGVGTCLLTRKGASRCHAGNANMKDNGVSYSYIYYYVLL